MRQRQRFRASRGIKFIFNVNEKAAVSLQLTEGGDVLDQDIDNQTTYEIQVNNDGNKEDTFSLSVNGNDWDTEFENLKLLSKLSAKSLF